MEMSLEIGMGLRWGWRDLGAGDVVEAGFGAGYESELGRGWDWRNWSLG